MSRSMQIVFLFFSAATIISCKKNDNMGAIVVNKAFTPLDMDSLLPGYGVVPYFAGKLYPNVSGVLVACRITASPVDTSGHTRPFIRNWEAALFASSGVDSLIPAGTVSVNGITLGFPFYDLYLNRDTSNVWNDSALNHWVVSGGVIIPSFSADVSGSYPSFTGTLPDSISKTVDFALTFNSANTSNGDSAYVVVYYYGTPVSSNVVSANGGTAVVPAAKLDGASNGYIYLPAIAASVTDPVYAGGGYILVIIYNHSLQTFGGKTFAFVKQRVQLGIVSFK